MGEIVLSHNLSSKKLKKDSKTIESEREQIKVALTIENRIYEKSHSLRNIPLDVEESFPPASPTHGNTKSDRTWTIIGTDGKRFKTNFKNSESGMRKASITSAQVERLLEYVKQNAPHLKLVKIKPGVLKLVRLSTEQQTHKITLKNDEAKSTKAAKDLKNKVELKSDRLPQGDYWTIKDHDKKVNDEKKRKKTKGHMIHFDLTSISRDDKKDSKIKDGPLHSFGHKDLPKNQQSGEVLFCICFVYILVICRAEISIAI